MKRSNRLVLLIGFFLAAVAFFAIIFLLGGGGGNGGEREGINESTIVVAAQEIPLGTTITDALVETQTVKETEKPDGAFTLESEVIGQTVTTQITKGQVITQRPGPRRRSTRTSDASSSPAGARCPCAWTRSRASAPSSSRVTASTS